MSKKGYWIGRIAVHNVDGYQQYVSQNGPVFAKFGGKFLVRGGRLEAPEGQARSRNVVIQFETYDAALACYHSEEYSRLVAVRTPHSTNDLIIIEGYDGVQPGEQSA